MQGKEGERWRQGKEGERWRQLAAEVAEEQNPDKFHELIRELNDMLEAKQNRIKELRNRTRPKPLGK
jgi:hypothetical protein